MSVPAGQLTESIGSPRIIHAPPVQGGPPPTGDGAGGPPPPLLHIDSVSPAVAAAGQVVTLNGYGFNDLQGSGYVAFTDLGLNWGGPGSEAPFQVESWSDTEITFVVPEPGGPGNNWAVAPNSTATIIVVRSDGIRSWPWSLLLTGVPEIDSLSAATAGPGTTIIITGRYFRPQQGSGYVAFTDNGVDWGRPGDQAVFQVVSWNDTQISFLVPQKDPNGFKITPGTTATVTVTNAAGLTSNAVELALSTDVNWPISLDSGVTNIGSTGDGHMETFVTIDQSGTMTAVTHTWDTDGWGVLTGFHGACTVAILDENNKVVDAFGSLPFGVEGGQSRQDTWTAELSQADVNVIGGVSVSNFYDPQYSGPASAWAWVAANESTIEAIVKAVVAIA
jgi:hypothetical protein